MGPEPKIETRLVWCDEILWRMYLEIQIRQDVILSVRRILTVDLSPQPEVSRTSSKRRINIRHVPSNIRLKFVTKMNGCMILDLPCCPLAKQSHVVVHPHGRRALARQDGTQRATRFMMNK